ncbi:MAG: hypothetical protein ACI9Y1_002260 [Lentisphaeria bacterium]|jgi:hypothetical protein
MKKRTYRTKNVNKIDWLQLKTRLPGKEISLTIDTAKEYQYAVLADEESGVLESIKWQHPQQT